jgi:hypothetical protein
MVDGFRCREAHSASSICSDLMGSTGELRRRHGIRQVVKHLLPAIT